MNCKPNDLARVVSNSETRFYGLVDKIVRVVSLYEFQGQQLWALGEPIYCIFGRHVLGIADELLRPIRDPGDDAVDEMVLKVGNPSHEEVVA